MYTENHMLRYVIKCRVGNIASLNDLRRKKQFGTGTKKQIILLSQQTNHSQEQKNKARPTTFPPCAM